VCTWDGYDYDTDDFIEIDNHDSAVEIDVYDYDEDEYRWSLNPLVMDSIDTHGCLPYTCLHKKGHYYQNQTKKSPYPSENEFRCMMNRDKNKPGFKTT